MARGGALLAVFRRTVPQEHILWCLIEVLKPRMNFRRKVHMSTLDL